MKANIINIEVGDNFRYKDEEYIVISKKRERKAIGMVMVTTAKKLLDNKIIKAIHGFDVELIKI